MCNDAHSLPVHVHDEYKGEGKLLDNGVGYRRRDAGAVDTGIQTRK